MADVVSLDFGIDSRRKPVTLRELPLNRYGLRCALSCPECGNPLEAVRKSADHPEQGWAYLRHHGDEDNSCPGYGDNSCHILAEHLLAESVGKKMRLPLLSVRDGEPHVSRYTDTGLIRPQWKTSPTDPLAGETRYHWTDWKQIPDLIVREQVEAKIVRVETEQQTAEGNIPDLLLELSVNGTVTMVAFEVRYAHAKTLNDVRKYQQTQMPVLECLVRDIDVHDEQAEQLLTSRLLGHTGFLEWLYHPQVRTLTDSRYRMTWSCTAYDAVVLRQLERLPSLHHWLPAVAEKVPANPITEYNLEHWNRKLYLGVSQGPAVDGSSIFELPAFCNMLRQVDFLGRPRLSDDEYEEEARLDEQRERLNLNGAHVVQTSCWKCRKPIVFWWMRISKTFPSPPQRVEERPQVIWRAIQKTRELSNPGMLCEFETRHPNKKSAWRAFTCPYCHSAQNDNNLYQEYLDRLSDEARRTLQAQEKQQQKQTAKLLERAYFRQLGDRVDSLQDQTDEVFDWLDQHTRQRMTPEALRHIKAARDHYRVMVKELDLTFDHLRRMS